MALSCSPPTGASSGLGTQPPSTQVLDDKFCVNKEIPLALLLYRKCSRSLPNLNPTPWECSRMLTSNTRCSKNLAAYSKVSEFV
eukprot:3225545-Amphidinium_carterae.1